MPVETETAALTYTPVKAPRGTRLSCKGWHQEAAMRMLMNNLDEEVGERPRDLVVYGGTGRAARNWESYHAIVASLRKRHCWFSRASRSRSSERMNMPPES